MKLQLFERQNYRDVLEEYKMRLTRLSERQNKERVLVVRQDQTAGGPSSSPTPRAALSSREAPSGNLDAHDSSSIRDMFEKEQKKRRLHVDRQALDNIGQMISPNIPTTQSQNELYQRYSVTRFAPRVSQEQGFLDANHAAVGSGQNPTPGSSEPRQTDRDSSPVLQDGVEHPMEARGRHLCAEEESRGPVPWILSPGFVTSVASDFTSSAS